MFVAKLILQSMKFLLILTNCRLNIIYVLRYREAGKRVAEVLQTFTPLLQRASVDEAYLDITEAVNSKLSSMTDKLSLDMLPNTHVVGCETKHFVQNVYNSYLDDCNLKLAVGGVIVEEIRAAVFEKTGK